MTPEEKDLIHAFVDRRLAEVGIRPNKRRNAISVMRFCQTEAEVDRVISELLKNTEWFHESTTRERQKA